MRCARMRMRGLEPPPSYLDTDLNRARLPIPPHPRGEGCEDIALSFALGTGVQADWEAGKGLDLPFL